MIAERNKKIISLREEGETFTSIAKKYGRSVERIRGIYHKFKRKQKEKEEAVSLGRIKALNISGRICTALEGEGIFFIDDVACMEDKRILRIPNIGTSSLGEIRNAIREYKTKEEN